MIKIGQIGIGHNHSNKLETIRRYPELFEVVGYAEENEEWIARRGDKPYFRDLPRLTVDEVIDRSDAVLVETDVWDLTKTAQRCVDAGKHVHIDKPASGTLAEFKHLLDTAEKKHLIVQPGYMYRYNPGVQKLFEMVKNGELGDISAIHAEMSVIHSDSYRKWLRNFRGGDMYIFGSHLIDLIVYLLGKPNRVLSSIGESGKNGVNAPDLTAAILEYDHAIARVFSSSVQWDGFAQRCFIVDGSRGTAIIRPMEDPCQMTFAKEYEGKQYVVQTAEPVALREQGKDERYDGMMKAFYDYIVGAAESPFTYAHEYALQETLDLAVGGVKMLGHALQEKKTPPSAK
ncbi:MAG: Gfo/Idh/MocA family oxidoreductase [Oscillospiraceae bacterium]|nr:Gfo/Idh/MocA family oxidoreductase [Oscillospiraceae bacterium]